MQLIFTVRAQAYKTMHCSQHYDPLINIIVISMSDPYIYIRYICLQPWFINSTKALENYDLIVALACCCVLLNTRTESFIFFMIPNKRILSLCDMYIMNMYLTKYNRKKMVCIVLDFRQVYKMQ